MTEWTERAGEWVRNAEPWMLLGVVAAVASNHTVDETMGDATERVETILWLASRGAEGRDWGSAAEAARQIGGFSNG